MRPLSFPLTLLTPALNNVCLDQTTSGAADLVINGSLASDGSVTLNTAHRIDIESSGSFGAVTFTVTGTDVNGAAQSDAIAGPSSSTVTTTKYFKTITQISVSAIVGTNVSVGTTDEAESDWFVANYLQDNFDIGMAVEITGTINYTVQKTYANILADETPVWFDDATLVTDTTNGNSAQESHVTGFRTVVNSYSSGATLTTRFVQGDT